MHGNPKNARESPLFFEKNRVFWILFQIFLIHLNAREYWKFGNPEREYRIPEIPVPGKFGNTEFPENSHSWTSVLPKENDSGMAPP